MHRFDDPTTYRLFAAGDTEGICRFDNPDSVGSLRRLAPDRFEHLVAFQALNRMSTLVTGLMDRYIARRHGKERPECEVAALAPYFADSYGLPLFREQLERAAAGVAGFSAEEAAHFAEAFRRHREEEMAEWGGRFVRRAGPRGVAEDAAREMVGFFRRTAPFTLPASMLASFAETGYRLAWLKAHRPDEFAAAVPDAPGRGPGPGDP